MHNEISFLLTSYFFTDRNRHQWTTKDVLFFGGDVCWYDRRYVNMQITFLLTSLFRLWSLWWKLGWIFIFSSILWAENFYGNKIKLKNHKNCVISSFFLIAIQISFSKLRASPSIRCGACKRLHEYFFKGDLNFQLYNDYNLINFSI